MEPLVASPVVAGLWQSITSSFGGVLMVLLGVAGILLGLVAIVQTTRWPSSAPTRKKPTPRPVAVPAPDRAAAKEAPRPVPARAATTTDLVRLRFPGIDERHPDVWDRQTPLDVIVKVDRARIPGGSVADVRLTTLRQGRRDEVGRAAPDDDGRVRFAVGFAGLGETDLVAELHIDHQSAGQAARAVRVVDYRAEIVETFEDFVAWAASQFEFADSRMTAREFVDRFADARSGTPVAPLETIADLYEVANYSEHPVDRGTYLRLVDAFLELEEAGALEGPEAR